MEISPDEILARIGLQANSSNSGSAKGEKSAHSLASRAIVHLIQTGKLSIQDVTNAVADAAKTVDAALLGKPIKKEANATTKHVNKSREKYRTRHVALQFSYDGTSFSGFAQNIGKEEDNSVEKALFAAMEKTRLLLEPSLIDFSNRIDGGADEDRGDMSARSASKYSRCGRTDKGKCRSLLK
jgi:hypothetical protein